MMRALNKEELDVVIDAMKEVKFNANSAVITEGEAGAVMYVVEEGELDCFKIISGKETFLKTFK